MSYTYDGHVSCNLTVTVAHLRLRLVCLKHDYRFAEVFIFFCTLFQMDDYLYSSYLHDRAAVRGGTEIDLLSL